MESHPCEKTRGEGVPGALPVPNPDPVSVAPPSDGAPLGARESHPGRERHGNQELRGSNKSQELSRVDGAPLGRPKVYPQDELSGGNEVRCQHVDARGHRCRMFVAPAEKTFGSGTDSDLADLTSDLCAHHARRLRDRQRAGQTAAAELLASVTDFGDAASVNRFLGNLLKLVAVRRIPRRDAIALAYISQLILNSQAVNDRGELLRYQLQLLRKKNTPTRVIWDLPRRRRDPELSDDSKPAENPGENPVGTDTGQ